MHRSIPGSIQADNGAGLTLGIIGLCNKGQPRKADDWGALRAWAWGASRAIDYFETDKAVDPEHIAIEGYLALRAERPRLLLLCIRAANVDRIYQFFRRRRG